MRQERDNVVLWVGGIAVVTVAVMIAFGQPLEVSLSWGIGAAVIGVLSWFAFGRDRPLRLTDHTSLSAASVLALARDWFDGSGWTLRRSEANGLTVERRLPMTPRHDILALPQS